MIGLRANVIRVPAQMQSAKFMLYSNIPRLILADNCTISCLNNQYIYDTVLLHVDMSEFEKQTVFKGRKPRFMSKTKVSFLIQTCVVVVVFSI